MGVIITPRRWSMKPPVGAQINFSHPLAIGLVDVWLLNEGGGSPVNVLNRCVGTMGATATWANGPDGPCVAMTGASTSQVVSPTTYSLSLSDSNVVSIATMATISDSGSRRTIYSPNDNSGGMQLEVGGATSKASIIIPGVYICSGPDYSFTANKWNSIVYTRNGSGATHSMYQDGVTVSLTVNDTTSFTDVNAYRYIGARGPGGYQNFKGSISYVYLWKRALSASDAWSLYADPYQFFVSPSRRFWSVPAAAGGSFQPAWAANSNQIIGGF